MTAKRDLKNRIRERLARTGESYTAARTQVLRSSRAKALDDAPRGPVPVVELVDLTEKAASLGILCRVLVYPDLLARIDATALLVRVRDAVISTGDDPASEAFRALILRGEASGAPLRTLTDRTIIGLRRFIAQVRAGIGGLSPGGNILAIHMMGREGLEAVLCSHLSHTPKGFVLERKPCITLTPIPEEARTDQPTDLVGFFL